jgi:threonine dehydratase
VFVGLQVQNHAEKEKLLAALHHKDLPAIDLSDNEMALLHVRHMVGGRAPGARNELMYRFEFPERPGALMRFLDSMSQTWNISLFHYRNHGADYGRVLVGIQVPPEDKQAFHTFLDKLGYAWWDENDNPAYRLFLG